MLLSIMLKVRLYKMEHLVVVMFILDGYLIAYKEHVFSLSYDSIHRCIAISQEHLVSIFLSEKDHRLKQ